MKVNDFTTKALWIAKELPTAYALGMWGWKLTPSAIEQKAKQYPNFYTTGKMTYLKGLKNTWGFDCVCLIKAILWGFGSNLKAPHGGAVYASNGVPDFGADGIKAHCSLYTSDFSLIVPGAILHRPDHVGIYVGNGLAVECTAAWDAKVIISAVGNIGKVAGYNTRTWDEWGKLNYVDYTEAGDDLAARLDKLERFVDRQLHVYHYWDDIAKELPSAYKPLMALYKAGLFAGASAADLNVNRTKAETLVCLAKALKQRGIISY